MTTGTLATTPPCVEVATTDELPLAIDMTEALSTVPGGTVTNVTATLVDKLAKTPVALANAPSVDGTVVTQIIEGAQLTAGRDYLLRIVFDAAADTVLTTITTISVPI